MYIVYGGSRKNDGAVNVFFLQCRGQEAADFVELLPGLRRRQVVVVLGLEGLLQIVAREDVLAVIEQEYIAVIREAVDLAVHSHLVVAVGRGNALQFGAESILVHKRVKHFERAGLGQVGHPRRDHVKRVVRTGARTIFLHDLGEHFGGRDFDDLNLASGLLFPQRARKLGRVQGLQAGFPDDGDGFAIRA